MLNFRLLVSGDDGFWLKYFLSSSKYRTIVCDHFDSQRYLFCPWVLFVGSSSHCCSETISGILRLKFWVTVCFSVPVLQVDGISEGKVVLKLWPNNFLADEVPFWSGCEFRDSIAIKWSSELRFALLRVRLTVWMDLSPKPFDWR